MKYMFKSKMYKYIIKPIRKLIIWFAYLFNAIPNKTFTFNYYSLDVSDFDFRSHDGSGEVVGIGVVGKQLNGQATWGQLRTYVEAFSTYFTVLDSEEEAIGLIVEYLFLLEYNDDLSISPEIKKAIVKHLKSKLKLLDTDLMYTIAHYTESLYDHYDMYDLMNDDGKFIYYKLRKVWDAHKDQWIELFLVEIIDGSIEYKEEWFDSPY